MSSSVRAETYRRVFGIHPAQRVECREALERIEAGGGMAVSQLIEVMRRSYEENGVLSVGDGITEGTQFP